ncbi:MAG: hypothetical protein P8X50_03000 [Maritimibacter sp.]|jgi:Flp pilus assembly protein TadD
MRATIFLTLCLGSTIGLSACDHSMDPAEVERAVGVNVIDESNLNDVMLNAGDPNEAVNYFQSALLQSPDRIDLQRGLAKSLVRAKKSEQAARVWADVVANDEATSDDKIAYADALIRAGEWDKADEVLKTIPPTVESFDRYRLEAMVADSNKDWKRADSFYETAVGLTTRPAHTLNNWGYSKLTRGDYRGAEKLFQEALSYDSTMFTAKNNLVMARGAQRQYDLPVMSMTQRERAQLYYTLGLTAVKQGDLTMGRTLLEQAVQTHPQHFDQAAQALKALEANVSQG